MKFLLQLYPGDQFMLLVATVIGQVAVIVVLGFILTRFPRRRPAATRSAIWLAALVCVQLMPLLACGFGIAKVELVRLPFLVRAEPETEQRLPIRVRQRRATPDAAATAPQSSEQAEKPHDKQSRVSVPEVSPIAVESASPSAELTSSTAADQWRAAAVCGLLLWFAGVSVFAVRFLYGCVVVKRLRAGARPVDDRMVVGIHQNVCRVLGNRRYPQIMTSPHVDGPIATNGLRGPIVILPDRLLCGLQDRQLRDVLMHESAHLLQRDILLGILQRVAQIIYWPHPMVHWLNRELSRAREDICDNFVLQQGDALGYSRTLVQLSAALPHYRTPIAACGMFDPISRLETRINTLLDEGRDLMTRTKRSLLLAFGLFFLGISVLSFGSKLVEARGLDDAADAVNQEDEADAADDGNAAPVITGRILFKEMPGPRILAVAFSPDDDLIATVDEQAKVVVRTADSGIALLAFSVLTPEEKKLLLHEDRQGRIHTAAIAFSPDPRLLTRTLAVACDSVIRFYDSETGRLDRSLEDKRLLDELKELGKDDPTEVKKLTTIPHAHGLTYSIAFSPDGSLLASSGTHLIRPGGRSVINAEIPTHGKLKLWDAKTGELKHDLGKHYDRVRSLAFSPGRLAVLGNHPPGPWTSSVRLWNPKTGVVESTITIRSGLFEETVALSPDGALVAAATAYQEPQPAGETTRRLGFGSPHLLVWDAKTGDLIIKRKMPKLVTSIAFSPDSKTLATGSSEGVTLRDPMTLQEKGKFQPPTSPLSNVRLAYFADGTRMAVAANDKKQGSLTLWKLDKP